MIHSKLRRALVLSTVLIPLISGSVSRVESGTVKVFILAGQSNMEGKGRVETGHGGVDGAIGSLRYLVNSSPRTYGHLISGRTGWAVRDDVWIWSTTDNGEKGNLTVGFGSSDQIGPELGFGNVVGDLYEDQVLLIKTAWGGKSLAVDFRPPRAGPPGVGFYYTEMLNKVDFVLDNLATEFPDYAGQGYEIVGFGWHQGWNDRINQAYNDEYESNLASFIRDIRGRRQGFGVAELPFVVAETGMTGPTEANPRALSLMAAQAAVANPVKYPEFEGNVAFVDTQEFWRDASESPSSAGYHWNNNGETYYLIGESMGRAMTELVNRPPVFAGYACTTPWQTPASLSVVKILTGGADPDGQSLAVTGAGPASIEGGTAFLQAGSILYTPPDGFSGVDRFPVAIADPLGATGMGTITVTVGAAPGTGAGGGSTSNPPQVTTRPDGTKDVQFQGIPGRTYRIERSVDMTIWTTLATVIASPTGQVTFIDENPPPESAFYRIAY